MFGGYNENDYRIDSNIMQSITAPTTGIYNEAIPVDYPGKYDYDPSNIDDEDVKNDIVYGETLLNIKKNDNDVSDIGIYGLARGIFMEDYQLQDDMKFLKIMTIDEFDEFTEKFAIIDEYRDINPVYRSTELLIIKWNEVANLYDGIYLNNGLKKERQLDSIYKDKIYKSWWIKDFGEYNIVKFVFDTTIKEEMIVQNPVPCKLYVENDFTKNSFVSYGVNSRLLLRQGPYNIELKDKKILRIFTANSFDKFTNEYGILENDLLKLNWKEIKKCYAGIYLDIDSDIKNKRKFYAMYDDNKYPSWVFNENIIWGVIYLFI